MPSTPKPEKALTEMERFERMSPSDRWDWETERADHEYEFDTPNSMIMQEVLAVPMAVVLFVAACVIAPFRLIGRLFQHKNPK